MWKTVNILDLAFLFTGSWDYLVTSTYLNGKAYQTNTVGSKIIFDFQGRGIKISSVRQNNMSANIKITIDGVEYTYSQYSASTNSGVLFIQENMVDSIHQVEIELVGVGYCSFDLVEIQDGFVLPPAQRGRVELDNYKRESTVQSFSTSALVLACANFGKISGKWYFEIFQPNIGDYAQIGVCSRRQNLANYNVSTWEGATHYATYENTRNYYSSSGGATGAKTLNLPQDNYIGMVLDLESYRIGILVKDKVHYEPLPPHIGGYFYPCLGTYLNTFLNKINFGAEEFNVAKKQPSVWADLVQQGVAPYDMQSAKWFNQGSTNALCILKTTQGFFTFEQNNWVFLGSQWQDDFITRGFKTSSVAAEKWTHAGKLIFIAEEITSLTQKTLEQIYGRKESITKIKIPETELNKIKSLEIVF